MGQAATSSSTSGLSSAAAPYLADYGQLIQNFAQRPFQNYQGPMVANLSPLQQQAIGGYSAVMPGAASTFGNAANQINATLTGQGGNPFTDSVVARTEKPVLEAYNAATAGTRANFNDAGGVGSARSGIAQDLNDRNLAQGLGDAVGNLYSNAYENERNRQMQAAGMVPSLASGASGFLNNAIQAGDIPRQQQQQVMDALRQQWENAYNYPLTQLQGVGSAIAPLFGALPRTSTTTGSPPDPVQQGLGILALGNMASSGSSKSS